MKLEHIKASLRKIETIKPYWKNPRFNGATIEALMEFIPKFGFNVPIVVDKEGIIVKGHARYGAAVRLGMVEIPCIVSSNDDEINKLDRIADNKVFELSKWNMAELKHLEQAEVVGKEAEKNRLPIHAYVVTCPYCGEVVE